MINVSFNELAIVSELPAPRTAPRPATASAFAALMNDADPRRDLPSKTDTPDSRADSRDAPAGERTTAPDGARANGRETKEFSAQETTPDPRSPVTKSQNGDSAGDVEPTPANTDTPQTVIEAGSADTTDKPLTGESQTATHAAPVFLIQTPAKLPDAQPNFGPANTVTPVAPQATNPAAPLPQGHNDLPSSPQTASSAALPTTPNALPTAAPSSQTDRSAAVPSGIADTTMPALPAPATGKVMSETLFAVTALSQAAVSKLSELNVVPPPTPAAPIAAAKLAAPVSSPTAPFNDAALATPAATKLSENFPTLEIAARDANAPQPSLMGPASSNPGTNVTTTASQQAKNMAPLFDAEGTEFTFSQTADSVSTKPAPALANGMISQIGAAMSAEGQAKTSNSSTPSTFGIAASAAAPNVNLTQTAMAVAATPMIQVAGDEPQPKFTAPADGLMVNTLGSTTSSHPSYASVTEAISTGKAPHATPPAFDQVAVHVAKAAAEGIDKINIKLKPATLGQIEVQLEIASDGRIHAVIAADKPETLDLLQRDARALERALGDAGLRMDSGSLSFNLRGQGEQNGGTAHGFADFSGGVAEPATNDSLFLGNADRIGAYLNSRAAAGGVDIRV